MRLFYSKKSSKRSVARLKNKVRIRKKVSGTADRPRLAVYRSSAHVYAQIIDDTTGTTIASASSLKEGGKCNKEIAKKIGETVAKAAMSKDISSVVFDRSGYVYHGRIQAVADGAREAGLKF